MLAIKRKGEYCNRLYPFNFNFSLFEKMVSHPKKLCFLAPGHSDDCNNPSTEFWQWQQAAIMVPDCLESFILQNHWRLLGFLEEFTGLQENVIFLTQKFAAHGTCEINFVNSFVQSTLVQAIVLMTVDPGPAWKITVYPLHNHILGDHFLVDTNELSFKRV
jgi:hypothetical protein